MTGTINHFMAGHHKECDEYFVQAESAIANADWQQGGELWQQFVDELEKHFGREENILFPAFEETTGMTAGPTQMMRIEHEQMRSLVSEMNKALTSHDQDQFLGLAESLMVTMQQHNMKEEQILYPMTDQSLPDSDAIIEKMLNIKA